MEIFNKTFIDVQRLFEYLQFFLINFPPLKLFQYDAFIEHIYVVIEGLACVIRISWTDFVQLIPKAAVYIAVKN